jgi:hypothetical protein
MIDAGMFSNFPGFLYIKSLAKQFTNQFRVPPGGGMPIDTAGQDIRSSIMPLPYKDPSAVFIQLIENIAQTAQRVGGTAELQIGEGKQDAPVGTTLAMIEQATKLMSAVHKRLHCAQGQEFDMLKSMLQEDPEALWRHNKKKSQTLQVLVHEAGLDSIDQALQEGEQRHIQLLLAALDCCELVPAADPNTSSQTERYLKVVALRQMAMTNQNIDMNAVDTRAMEVMGIDDPESFFKPPDPVGAAPPNPQLISAQANMVTAQARVADSHLNAQETAAKIQQTNMDLQNKSKEIDAREKIAALDVARTMVVHKDDHDLAQQNLASDNAHQNADRQVDINKQQSDQAHGIALAKLNNTANTQQSQGVAQSDFANQVLDHAHQMAQEASGRQHELGLAQQQQAHERVQQQLQQEHQIRQASMASRVKPISKPKGKT